MRSPLAGLLAAVDQLDSDGAAAMCAPDCTLLTVDGHQATGRDAVRTLLRSFFAELRSTSHEVIAEWQFEDVWIAELLASYELRDWLKLEKLPRAIVVRTGPDGIRQVHVYGAHEQPLADRDHGDRPVRVGGRLLLPL